MRIIAKPATATEISAFLSQHKPGTIGYLLGEGSKLLGYTGEITVEDFLGVTCNPEHAAKEFIHIKISAKSFTEIPTALNEITESAEAVERCTYGYQVQDDILGSFRAGMIAGLFFHAQTARGGKTPHGHLIVVPRVVSKENGQVFFHQLDAKRLLKALKE